MSKPNFLKNLAEQLTAMLPTHLSSLKKDFEKNCEGLLNKTFAKLDLVTRDEFDVQTKVLARTRKKIESLEKQVQSLEDLLKSKHHGRKDH